MLYVSNPSTVCRLFQAAVDVHTHRVAVECIRESWSYSRLHQRQSQWRAALLGKRIGRGQCVGVSIRRSCDVPAVILAILSVGAIYVPMDAAQPRKRLSVIAADCGLDLIIGEDCDAELAQELSCSLLTASKVGMSGVENASDKRSYACNASPDEIAYILYTSGSTGRPKGVEIRHSSLANYLVALTQRHDLTCSDSVINITPLTFDPSLREILCPLINGGRMVMLEEEHWRDPSHVARVLAARTVSCVLGITPTFLKHLIPALRRQDEDLHRFRLMLVSGESLSMELVSQCHGLAPNLVVVNHYGPTEITMTCCAHEVPHRETSPGPHFGQVPIGQPFGGARIRIMAGNNTEAGPGEVGEIVVEGPGIARGYRSMPEETAQKFRTGPDGERVYYTGDLGSVDVHGILHFMGRTDRQVKISGKRIELSEIEAVLLTVPSIRQAAVEVVSRPGGEDLIGFLVASGPLDERHLRTNLARFLPPYMLPKQFVRVEALPLLPNHKIDRSVLRQLDLLQAQDDCSGGDAVSETLKSVWSAILDIPPPGPHANFFESGGDSLRALQLISTVSEHFDIELPLIEMFNRPIFSELTAYIRAAAAAREGSTKGNDQCRP